MSARDTIELAVHRYYRRDADPRATAIGLLADYDASQRVKNLTEGIDALRKWLSSCSAAITPGLKFAIGVLTSVRDDRDGTACEAADGTFFQPGHRYAHDDWLFHCATVTAHPHTGKRVAIGWIAFPNSGWTTYAHSEAEWAADWTDVDGRHLYHLNQTHTGTQ